MQKCQEEYAVTVNKTLRKSLMVRHEGQRSITIYNNITHRGKYSSLSYFPTIEGPKTFLCYLFYLFIQHFIQHKDSKQWNIFI